MGGAAAGCCRTTCRASTATRASARRGTTTASGCRAQASRRGGVELLGHRGAGPGSRLPQRWPVPKRSRRDNRDWRELEHVYPRHQCRLSRFGRLPGPGRHGRRRGGGGTVHPHQARQAADSVLDLRTAVPCDRLLPARGGHHAGRRRPRRLLLRSRPAARPASRRRHDHAAAGAERPARPQEWESAWDPLFLSLDRQCPAPAGRRRPAPPAGALPGRPARRSATAGISWSTTWPTRPAPSSPRRSTRRPS